MPLKQALSPGVRPPGARRALQVLIAGVALLFLFRFGLPGMVLGGSYLAGGATVTARLDSEARFLSAIAFGIGCLALWLVRNFEAYPALAVFIGAFALLGGLMRIVSMTLLDAFAGPEVVAAALEILIPISVVTLLSRRASPPSQE